MVEAALLQDIKEGAAALGIEPSTLCHRAVKNGYVAKRLENGKTVTMVTARKIRAFIAAELARRNIEAAE